MDGGGAHAADKRAPYHRSRALARALRTGSPPRPRTIALGRPNRRTSRRIPIVVDGRRRRLRSLPVNRGARSGRFGIRRARRLAIVLAIVLTAMAGRPAAAVETAPVDDVLGR
jgi:hypothetical protein